MLLLNKLQKPESRTFKGTELNRSTALKNVKNTPFHHSRRDARDTTSTNHSYPFPKIGKLLLQIHLFPNLGIKMRS